MALPTTLDDIGETTPNNMVEDEIIHEIPDTRWTTSIWSEADIPQKKKPSLVQGPWEHGRMSGSRVRVTDEKSRGIRHKTDKNILVILSLDKTVVDYSTILGFQGDLDLVGNRFYWVVSIVLIAQLVMFLSTGLMTIFTVPILYWKLEDNIQTASFFSEDERAMAIERLRANQAGSDSREIRWGQVSEALKDVKTSLFFIMSLANSLGSQVPNTFGPLMLDRLGYDEHTTLLLNIPFGALQYIVVLGVSWLATKFRWKSLTLGSALVPVITGLVILFALPQDTTNTAVFLIGYHLLSFIFGCNTLILSWVLANTAGQAKKSVTVCFYSAASSTGSILGPLLFKASDAPRYDLGLKITLGVYIGIFWAVIVQVVNLVLLNRAQERRRINHEKPARLHDSSMEERYADINENNQYDVGNFAFADLTDKQNDEFVYVY
ncbi:hypothetical protein N8I77_007024 [Diaporthe amygdali]|uniref:Uncharacterized protein n=1 Tax=Phomopsis amygdali TaxID=1214568 RepID=A0AAD9SC71_PHOAM|nr:hypothetical protein N8I77_007024 [Diaporthe amygdali]